MNTERTWSNENELRAYPFADGCLMLPFLSSGELAPTPIPPGLFSDFSCVLHGDPGLLVFLRKLTLTSDQVSVVLSAFRYDGEYFTLEDLADEAISSTDVLQGQLHW